MISKVEFHQVDVDFAIQVFKYYRPIDDLDISCFKSIEFLKLLKLAISGILIENKTQIILAVASALLDFQYKNWSKETYQAIEQDLIKRGLESRLYEVFGEDLIAKT